MEHPRWGAILGLITTRSVKSGEELLVYYGYKPGYDVPLDYPWYWELKRQVEKEERLKHNKNKNLNA